MFLAAADYCKTRIPKPFSLLRLTLRCRVLRPRWCQMVSELPALALPFLPSIMALQPAKLPTYCAGASPMTSRLGIYYVEFHDITRERVERKFGDLELGSPYACVPTSTHPPTCKNRGRLCSGFC